jgi:RNA polymerase sigma-70 factor (ECF subfamily)
MVAASLDALDADAALADRARGGSGAAFAALVTRHRDALFTIASNMCATRADCEHMLQQVLLAAWDQLGSFRTGTRFATWLYRIAIKTALIHPQVDRRGPSRSLEAFLPAFDSAGRVVAGKGPWRQLDGSTSKPIEIAGLLREALECIDDRLRAAFVLRDVLRLSIEDVAAVLETSPAVVLRDGHRARLMLRGFIDQL